MKRSHLETITGTSSPARSRLVLFSEDNSPFGERFLREILRHEGAELVAVVTRKHGTLCPDYQDLAAAMADAVAEATTVPDVGSGPGHLSKILAARGKNVVAIDSNDAMLRCAYDQCAAEIENGQIEIHKANLESISERELSSVRSVGFRPPYDAVVMLNVFYAIPDKTALLDFVKSVMKPGAILTLSGPNDNVSLNRLFANVAKCRPQKDDEERFQSVKKRMFAQGILTQSIESTSRLLTDAGFEILQTDPTVFGKQGVLFIARLKA